MKRWSFILGAVGTVIIVVGSVLKVMHISYYGHNIIFFLGFVLAGAGSILEGIYYRKRIKELEANQKI
ncbi:MAG: hypothetical protein ACPF8V_09915 [Luteibaculum sp.]